MSKPTRITNSIRSLRFAHGEMTQAELAQRIGVTRQTIYAIEAGDYVPNTTVALQLAKTLEVSVEELFSLDAESAAAPKPVAVEFITPTRHGEAVQLCRVGHRTIGVAAAHQPLMLPAADAVAIGTATPSTAAVVWPLPPPKPTSTPAAPVRIRCSAAV